MKISNLKVGEKYYILDDYEGCPVITEIKVVSKKKGVRVVENIKHLSNNYNMKKDFYFRDYNNYDECRFMDIDNKFLTKHEAVYKPCDLETSLTWLLNDYIENNDCFDCDNYVRPEDYPDWDGDESIVYYR